MCRHELTVGIACPNNQQPASHATAMGGRPAARYETHLNRSSANQGAGAAQHSQETISAENGPPPPAVPNEPNHNCCSAVDTKHQQQPPSQINSAVVGSHLDQGVRPKLPQQHQNTYSIQLQGLFTPAPRTAHHSCWHMPRSNVSRNTQQLLIHRARQQRAKPCLAPPTSTPHHSPSPTPAVTCLRVRVQLQIASISTRDPPRATG
jgi:hypothetical protein